MFADVHSHLLPAMDDGAKNQSQSAALLQKLSSQGITHLALTPHYYPMQISLEDFVSQRKKAFEVFSKLPEAEGMTLTLGAEVYLSDAVMNNEDLSPLCYQGTTLMLTELKQATGFTQSIAFSLRRLMVDFSITPVLAHIDRYPFLYGNIRLLYRLREMGCLFQLNLDAFEGFFRGRRALRLYDLGLVDFVGEDVHQRGLPRERRQKLLASLEKRRPGMMRKLSENAAKLLFLKEE